MKKINKFCFSLIVLLIVFNFTNVFMYTSHATLGSWMGQASAFISAGESQTSGLTNQMGEITESFLPIGQLLTMIGAGVMVAVTTFLGIKYVTASPETQGKLKQQLVGVVVSGVVIFGAYGIWSIVISIAENFD